MPASLSFAEKHYRVAELAELWAVSPDTIRRLVKDEPDVVKVKKGPKAVNTVYSIPASAAQRIHTKLLTAS